VKFQNSGHSRITHQNSNEKNLVSLTPGERKDAKNAEFEQDLKAFQSLSNFNQVIEEDKAEYANSKDDSKNLHLNGNINSNQNGGNVLFEKNRPTVDALASSASPNPNPDANAKLHNEGSNHN